MSRVTCGRIKPGLGEDNTIKNEGNLEVQGDLEVTGSINILDLVLPGMVIGFNCIRVDDPYSYVGPVGDQLAMPEVAISITPKKANSLLVCQWYLHGEGTTHNLGFRVLVNGALPLDGYNTATGYVNWSTLASNLYDGNNDSTPRITPLNYVFVPGNLSPQTITPAVHATGTSAGTYRLNRTAGSAGANAYENGVSWGYVWEIAQ